MKAHSVWTPFACQSCEGKGCLECRSTGQGPQYRASASGVNRLLYGGAAGGGKSAWLIAELLRDVHQSTYRGLLLRESLQDARDLVDKAQNLYKQLPQIYSTRNGWNGQRSEFTFKSGAKIRVGYLRTIADIHHYDGPGYDDLMFDELVHFNEECVRQLLARGRTNIPGRKVRMRCTSNPPRPSEGQWVRDWWAPWLRRTTYPWPAEPGEIRYFLPGHDADGNPTIDWLPPTVDAKAWLRARSKDARHPPKLQTASFIPATVRDNPIYASSGYEDQLRLQSLVRYKQLALGDWEAEYTAGNVFRSDWWGAPITAQGRLPSAIVRARVRFWDRAASEVTPTYPDPDWSAGVLLALTTSDEIVVEDVIHGRWVAGLVDDVIEGVAGMASTRERLTAEFRRRRLDVPPIDPPGTLCVMEEDPGQAGKGQADAFLQRMRAAGITARTITARSRGGKVDRADAASAACYRGRVKTLAVPWRTEFIAELSAFPTKGIHDDQVDAFTGAFDMLEDYRQHRRWTLGRDR